MRWDQHREKFNIESKSEMTPPIQSTNDLFQPLWEKGGLLPEPMDLKPINILLLCHIYCVCIQVILVCDNLNGDATVKCSYAHTVGTKFSDEISEGGDIDMTIGVEMQAQMWGIFLATGSWSASTGYHWDHVSTETKSDQITITVEAEAPPGTNIDKRQS